MVAPTRTVKVDVVDLEFWRRACMELQARVQSLEEALGMVYQSRPHKVFHAKRAVLNGLNNEGGSDGVSTIVSSVGLDTQPAA